MKKLLSNEVSLLVLLMLLSAPLGFSRSIVLGDYYYPREGSRWIERSGKTEFKIGDTIIVQDSRVALGRGLIQGEIAYLLDDIFVNVVEVRNTVNEFVTQQVYGATPFGAAQSEGHAIAIQIFVRSGSIGATYHYWDTSARGEGRDVKLATIDATNLATIVPDSSPDPGVTPVLSVQASAETVLANKSFTLTANLDAVSYTFQQTISGLAGKAQVSQGTGVTVDPATGVLTLTGGKSVTFNAPDVAPNNAQGTITFEVQATLAGNVKSNVATKLISVLKEVVSSTGGTPVGTPQGGNQRADGYLLETNPKQAEVNVPFTLVAFGRDPDGTKISDPNIGVPGGAGSSFITGKWEKIPVSGAPQVLQQKQAAPATTGAYEQFPLITSEPSEGVYKYRFTITDAAQVGNYYETTVSVTTTPCEYSIAPTSQSFTGAGGSGSFNVSTNAACSWTATPDSAFITITSGASGTGNGTVSFSVAANPGSSSRSGKITAGGKVFAVTQASSCAYAISPQSRSFSGSGGTGTIAVSTDAGCAWTVTKGEDSDFITITSGVGGSGNGTVSYSVAPNPGTKDRTGKITVAGQLFTVTQASSCIYKITPENQSFPAAGGEGRVTVSTDAGCAWTATTDSTFIAIGPIITTGAGSTGNGYVTYSVAANPNPGTRTGTITVAGQTFTVNQGETGILYFAMVGNGEGVVSDLLVNNPSSTMAIAGKIEFLDKNGAPLALGLSSEATAKSTADFSLSPLGSVIVSTSGKGTLASGAVRVTADGALGGIVRFTVRGAGIAGVSASIPLNGFVVPVRRKLGVNSSIALHNVETGPVSATLTLLDKQGRRVDAGTRTLDLVGGGQEALFLNELFPAANTTDFEGTLMVVATAGKKVAAVALEMGRQIGEFTVLPVIPLK